MKNSFNFYEDLSDKEENSFVTKKSSQTNICVKCGGPMTGTRREKAIYWRCTDQHKVNCDGTHTENSQKD